jgi:TolB-like protein
LSLLNELKRRNVIRVGIAYAVVSWLILQVADVILNNVSAPDWVFWVTLMLLGIGFIMVVVFSWAFELTPEGLKREHEVDRSQSITGHTGKKLDRLIIGVLVLALSYFTVDKFVLSSARDAALVEATRQAINDESAGRGDSQAAAVIAEKAMTDNSIAVLPFVNMSEDASNEYFSDGISEELLNLLAKVPELRVAARTSSFSLKGKDLQMSEVGEILNVDHVLEGSVRKAGNQVRITAQLIKIDDGFHMWSETYDRSLDNIFAVQDEIARHVVEQLKITLLGEAPRTEEVDPQAYSLFLQARHLGRMSSEEGFLESNKLYQRVLELEPDYPSALDGLATNYVNMASNGLLPAEEATALALDATKKALAINPNYAKGYDSLGWLALVSDNDLAAAASYYQKALDLDASDPAIVANASVIPFSLGRMEEAVALMERAVESDPVNITAHNNLAQAYLYAGQPSKAKSTSETALRLSPDRLGTNSTISMAELLMGEADAAWGSIQKEGSESARVSGELLILHSQGREQEFRSSLDAFKQKWGEAFPSRVAIAYAWSGQNDSAFQWLDVTRNSSDPGASFLHADPFLAGLHDDPRWIPFLESIGQSPEQLDAIEFEITLPD